MLGSSGQVGRLGGGAFRDKTGFTADCKMAI